MLPPFALMKALHTLGILSTSFMRNAFPTVLKELPHMLSTWMLFFHSAVQLIPNHLNWVEVRWLWRPGDLMQHSTILLLGQIALTQPGGVLSHCPDKHESPTKCKPDGRRIATECCDSHAVLAMLLHASQWEPHMQRWFVNLFCVSKTRWLETNISNLDSSDQRTDFHRSIAHASWFTQSPLNSWCWVVSLNWTL